MNLDTHKLCWKTLERHNCQEWKWVNILNRAYPFQKCYGGLALWPSWLWSSWVIVVLPFNRNRKRDEHTPSAQDVSQTAEPRDAEMSSKYGYIFGTGSVVSFLRMLMIFQLYCAALDTKDCRWAKQCRWSCPVVITVQRCISRGIST